MWRQIRSSMVFINSAIDLLSSPGLKQQYWGIRLNTLKWLLGCKYKVYEITTLMYLHTANKWQIHMDILILWYNSLFFYLIFFFVTNLFEDFYHYFSKKRRSTFSIYSSCGHPLVASLMTTNSYFSFLENLVSVHLNTDASYFV